jgi:acyl carrier protein
MGSARVAKKVEGVIQRQLHVADRRIEPSMDFVDDLGADSLALVDLTLALEEAFDIDIDGDDVEGLCTVQDAIDYVGKRLSPAPGPRAAGSTNG